MTQLRLLAVTVTTILATLMLIAAAGCGDDDDDDGDTATSPAAAAESDEAEVEAAIRAHVEAFNNKDPEAWTATSADELIVEADRNGDHEVTPDEMGGEDPPITDLSISNIEVNGDQATAEVSGDQGELGQLDERWLLIRDEGVWKVAEFQGLAE